jgi:hypothetical protein
MEEGGDQKQCEPKDTLGGSVLAGRHFDGVKLWDLAWVSRDAVLVELGRAQGGKWQWGCRLMIWGMFFLGSVLIGKKVVAYLRRRFCR